MQVGKRTQGVAMLMAIMLLIIVAGIGTLLFSRTLGEIKHSADDTAIVQTLMLARGAANLGGSVLTKGVRDKLEEALEPHTKGSSPWLFGRDTNKDGKPDSNTVVPELDKLAATLQSKIDDITCQKSISSEGESGTMSVRIHMTTRACSSTLPSDVKLPSGRFVSGSPRGTSGSDQEYAMPFVMVAEGTVGDYTRNVVLQGEYRFIIGQGSFAKYALFTNEHQTSGGNAVYFTDRTLFDGPVHTNQFFRYYRKPWFGAEVTSAGCSNPSRDNCAGSLNRQGAEFYNEGHISNGSMSPSSTNPSYANGYGTHAPELTGGVDWSARFVPMPENTDAQRRAAQGVDDRGDPLLNETGLALDGDVTELRMWAADASGNPLTKNFRGDWAPAATYQYIQVTEMELDGRWELQRRCGRRSCWYQWVWVEEEVEVTTTYRYKDTGIGAKKLERLVDPATNNWGPDDLLGRDFNGVIYVDGEVDRFTGPERVPANSADPADAPPALASFGQITLATEDRIRITGDLTYEDPPCVGSPERDQNGDVKTATCDNLSARNVLGIYAQNEDILIGNYNYDSSLNAPDNITIHGVVMSGERAVKVENHDAGSPRGNVNLLGGLIEYNYGAFGIFDANTGSSKYGYDRRFTYDRRMADGFSPPYFPTIGASEVNNVILFSFGQREQVY